MTAQPNIAIVTSIPQNIIRYDDGRLADYDYQKICIQSLIGCGFRVMSVNDREEIRVLAPKYPEVEFIEAEINVNKLTGRKIPSVFQLLVALTAVPESVVGIINSDIVFEPSPIWQQELPRLVVNAAVVGQRIDATSLLRGATLRFPHGFDYFFFERAAIKDFIDESQFYSMGLPWWDYWLPIALALKRRQIVVLDRPYVLHLIHKVGYHPQIWLDFALRFAECVTSASNSCDYKSTSTLELIVSHCHTMRGRGRECDRRRA